MVLCLLYSVYLLNHTAVESLSWRTPIEACFGDTPDISPLLQFTFYEPVYFLDQDTRFPETGERLGRFVGITENHGDALTYWILTPDNQLLARSVVRTATGNEPNQWASTSTESKGSEDLESTGNSEEVLNLKNPTQEERGVRHSVSVPRHWI